VARRKRRVHHRGHREHRGREEWKSKGFTALERKSPHAKAACGAPSSSFGSGVAAGTQEKSTGLKTRHYKPRRNPRGRHGRCAPLAEARGLRDPPLQNQERPKTQVQKPAFAKASAGKPNLGHPQEEVESDEKEQKKRQELKMKKCWAVRS